MTRPASYSTLPGWRSTRNRNKREGGFHRKLVVAAGGKQRHWLTPNQTVSMPLKTLTRGPRPLFVSHRRPQAFAAPVDNCAREIFHQAARQSTGSPHRKYIGPFRESVVANQPGFERLVCAPARISTPSWGRFQRLLSGSDPAQNQHLRSSSVLQIWQHKKFVRPMRFMYIDRVIAVCRGLFFLLRSSNEPAAFLCPEPGTNCRRSQGRLRRLQHA
ncbi:MAG: hypothetical protein JWR21_3606 [Herminiimonas sp.]|nr:hypothetical protein [Herminiimonas sp.]